MGADTERFVVDLEHALRPPAEEEIQQEMRNFFLFHIQRGRIITELQSIGSEIPQGYQASQIRISGQLASDFPMLFRGKQFLGVPLTVDQNLEKHKLVVDLRASPSESAEGTDGSQ